MYKYVKIKQAILKINPNLQGTVFLLWSELEWVEVPLKTCPHCNSVNVLPSSKLILVVDSTDDNYMPKRITVYGGEGDNLKKLSDVTIDVWVF